MSAINTANHPSTFLGVAGQPQAASWSRGLASDLSASSAASSVGSSVSPQATDKAVRERIGEFVGNIFYGTLIREMHASKLKGERFHGGRGEEVFQGQLGMEIAQRLGRAPGDPIAEHMYESFMRWRNKSSAAEQLPAGLDVQAETRAVSAGAPDVRRGES